MSNEKKFIVSHAPFWHNGSGIPQRYYQIMLAAIPAVIAALAYFGIPALGVISLGVASAVIWELALDRISKRPTTVGDGHAAMTGLLMALVLPATTPWWIVIVATFFAIIISKQIFGGIGSNPFNPVALSYAILMLAWKDYFNIDNMLVNYDFSFAAAYPLAAAKHFGPAAVQSHTLLGLFIGQQSGALGATCGLALTIGGIYLILRGIIRWEISISFIAGILVTALIFQVSDPARFAGPGFHLLTGLTLIGAFFLATEDSSSPVNFLPMLIYGALAGTMTVVIRNIGAYPDGVIFALLLANLVNPLLDKIRPKALGKVVSNG
jgi:electron transport complex protein RnfD